MFVEIHDNLVRPVADQRPGGALMLDARRSNARLSRWLASNELGLEMEDEADELNKWKVNYVTIL